MDILRSVAKFVGGRYTGQTRPQMVKTYQDLRRVVA